MRNTLERISETLFLDQDTGLSAAAAVVQVVSEDGGAILLLLAQEKKIVSLKTKRNE